MNTPLSNKGLPPIHLAGGSPLFTRILFILGAIPIKSSPI